MSEISEFKPRLLCVNQAASYLGIGKDLFNEAVRFSLPQIRLGKRAIRFDKLDLDAWIEENKQLYGCLSKQPTEVAKWDKNTKNVASKKGAVLGTSIKPLTDDEYDKALEQMISKRLNAT